MNSAVSGSPVLVTLATGLMIAFAVQLLLTSFGIAAGMTALGLIFRGRSSAKVSEAAIERDSIEDPIKQSSSSGTAGKIGAAVGLGTLFTVNTVLFIACFLAVKLSLVTSVAIGAILGIVIWSGYFLILVWIGSSAVGSLLGSIANTLTAGVQGLITSVKTVLGGKPNRPLPDALQEQAAATQSGLQELRQELQAVRQDQSSLDRSLHEYLQTLQPPKPDLQAIGREFAEALNGSELQSLTRQGLLTLDRQTLVDLVTSRTDFSKQDVHQIVEQLETVWREREADPIADLTTFLQSAQPEQLTSEELSARLSRIPEPSTMQGALSGQIQPKQMMQQLARTVWRRVDLSDLDVSKVIQQLQAFIQDAPAGSEPRSFNPIQTDVEDFLLQAYPWHLTRKTVQIEFKDVLLDPEADPIAVLRQLEPLNRDAFVSLLRQRDDLSNAKIERIADRLEAVRQEVLATLQTAGNAESHRFLAEVADYLQSAKLSTLKPAAIKRQLKQMLQTTDLPLEQWRDRLQALTPEALIHAGLGTEGDRIWKLLATARDRLLSDLSDLQTQSQSAVQQIWSRLEQYVRDPDHTLTVRNLQRQLKTLLKDTKLDPVLLRYALPEFDREAVIGWLTARQNLSHARILQVADQLESLWPSLIVKPAADHAPTEKPPRRVAVRRVIAEEEPDVIESYLREADREDLIGEGAETLKRLFQSIAQRSPQAFLAQVDRTHLASLLSQRSDLTEAEVQHLLDQADGARQQLVEQLQTLQQAAQTALSTLLDQFRQSLSAIELPELDYDRLKSELSQLLAEPQTQLEALGDAITDRWQDANRDAITALLKARDDISESFAHEVVDRIDAVRLGVLQQANALQQDANRRMDALKQQAQQQASDARSAIAIAAWWLFSTALSSALTAALAGAIAVGGLSIFPIP
ncbi:hypothetical protein H6F43_06185 [Leptolyngbya sp. FACHB-36]|uniref:hypothetical protein n=1 Tax=Leptolyngbya sp. FACHB-36 TaxID=2692808 RepID=UPI00168141D8|nr:hypothetical protein [Leptolyngbya sp. FACHB-36]MBD2019775.1 hypothetical protein [Leptolyngbya sp. FACHB-36]